MRMGRPIVGDQPDPEQNPMFHNVNRNKLSITLNTTQPQAVALARKLVARCDVVIENFSPGLMARLGLDYEELQRIKPALIMASISSTGQAGPLRDLRDSVAEAVGVPGAYDYGPQHVSWLGTLLTNWIGDDAFLKRLRVECRRFNVYGDTQWCKGRVVRKYIYHHTPLVDVEIWAENQRGEVTAPGFATVILPSRDPKIPWFTGGSGLSLRDAPPGGEHPADPAGVMNLYVTCM
jgi:hypothetical protein